MLYEMRCYDIEPTRWDEYLDWAYSKAFPIMFDQFGFRLVAWWQAVQDGQEPQPSTNLYWILAWDSEQEKLERWAALRASENWQAALAAEVDPTTGRRLYIRQTRSILLNSLPQSPLA